MIEYVTPHLYTQIQGSVLSFFPILSSLSHLLHTIVYFLCISGTLRCCTNVFHGAQAIWATFRADCAYVIHRHGTLRVSIPSPSFVSD
jgi:hypothetical protein